MVSLQNLKEVIVSNEEFILKEIKEYVYRGNLVLPETANKVVVFYGVRRCGKTFTLYEIFKKHPENSLYVDFEDDRLDGFETADFERLKKAFFELKPHLANSKDLYFLLDEVQEVPGWEKFCRRAVEREGIKIFVSGSSSKVMPGEIQTELRGRSWNIEMFPFSFVEYLHQKGVDTNTSKIVHGRESVAVKHHFTHYAKWGGFPEVCFAKSEFEKRKILREYLEAMFFKDMVERYRITNVPLLDRLFDKVFTSFSTKMSLTAFYKQYHENMPFSKDILFSYYHYMQQSMLMYEVKMFAESSYKRMRNPAKIYPADIGLCRRITSADAGRLLEAIVFLEFKRRGSEVFYFSGGHECDFVVKTGDAEFIPYQVCADLHDKNREREIEGLKEACEHLGRKQGFLLTDNEEDELSIDGITISVLPAWKWILHKAD
jgi:hypothetical protein